MPKPKTWWCDGQCPFLTCEEMGPHSHPICPDCEAVRYGNLFCATCRAHNDIDAPAPKGKRDALRDG